MRLHLFASCLLFIIFMIVPMQLSAQQNKPLIDQERMFYEINELKKEVSKLRKEAEVRKSLSETKKEKDDETEKVLNAAGREYTLMKKSTFGLEYSLRYSYSAMDKIIQLSKGYGADYRQDHVIENSLFFEYALFDNFTFNTNLPFIYKYKNMNTEKEQDLTELGDISIGVQYQPFKSGGKWPTTILNTSVSIPSGTSPYDVVVGEELYSGSGAYSLSLGLSMSKAVDPVFLFSTISGLYYLPVDNLDQKWGSKGSYSTLEKVTPGYGIGLSGGFAYSMSYQISLTLGYQLSYRAGSNYEFKGGGKTSSESYMTSSISIGTSWRINTKKALHFKLNVGLTDNDSDFSVSVRVPMEFSF